MAAKFTALSLNAVKRQILLPSKVKAVKPTMQQRTHFQVFTETGAIGPKPEIARFGWLKVMVVTTPCVILSGYMSREFAALLEEHDIFSFNDDDDD